MKTRLTIFCLIVLILGATPAFGETQTVTVTGVTITRQRNFPTTLEVRTASGMTFTGTGTLNGGPTGCTSLYPCLSGTFINDQFSASGFSGTLDGHDISIYLGRPVWIAYMTGWIIPYFSPFGRPIQKTLPAVVYAADLQVYDVNQPQVPLYSAQLALAGSMKVVMSPLQRFQAPRPYSEFWTVDIELAPQNP